jgi:uncharacterized protein
MSWIDELPAGRSGWRVLDVGDGLSIDVFYCRGPSPGPLAVVIAGVHGDEYEGINAAGRLCAELRPGCISGTVLVVPVANPPAFAAGTRLNPPDGANLARCFPGNPSGSPMERLAARIYSDVASHAQYLIDLHSGGVEYDFLPVAGFYGQADSANQSYSAACAFGLPALWQLPPTPGVLSYEAHCRGAVAIGCEYRGGGRLDPEGREKYREGVLACLNSWGMFASGSAPQPEIGAPPAYEGDWVLADATGIFVSRSSLGDRVAAGALRAEIESTRDGTAQPIYAPRDGVILGLRNKAYITAGNWAVLVASACRTAE